MAKTGTYCKAYPVERFQEFAGWHMKPASAAATPSPSDASDADASAPGPEEAYFFLQDDLTVTRGIYMDEEIVFDEVTDEWRAFCQTQLQFEVPEYARPGADES